MSDEAGQSELARSLGWRRLDTYDKTFDPALTIPAPRTELAFDIESCWPPVCLLCSGATADEFAVVRGLWVKHGPREGWWDCEAEEPLDAAVLAWMPLPYADQAQDAEAEACIACDKAFTAGDLIYPDVSGGFIHADCCGPERESYVGGDGEPLGPADPIPEPQVWVSEGASHV